LTTLTVIDDCLKLIGATQNVEVNMATVPLDDQTTYEQIFHKALTSESSVRIGGHARCVAPPIVRHGGRLDRAERALSSGTDPGRDD